MDLSTTYLGFKLPHPFMPGASPMVDDLDTVKKLEDAGAAAIVMHSLFEEQITREQMATFRATDTHGESFAEATSFFPSPDKFALGPEQYLDHVRRVKEAVSVPVIASLNGTTLGGWLEHARLMEQAGADALELNVYSLASDPEATGQALKERTLEMLRPGGVLYFSTGRRRFRFEGSRIRTCPVEVEDLTEATTSADFRARRAHRCWRITRA